MRQNQLPFAGLILALIFGVRLGLPKVQPYSDASITTRSAKQKPEKSAAVPAPEFPPLWTNALCKLNPSYGSTDYVSHQRALEKPRSDGDPLCLKDQAGHNFKLDVLSIIAAVPDPVHTHLGLSFDRTIDAIQTAASEGEPAYLPYLNALPWPPPQAKSDSPVESTSEYQYPGILLFRKSGQNQKFSKAPEYLAVFLVPELPTSGIDPTTFKAAVRIMCKISPKSAHTIGLVGPNFSGSVRSLLKLTGDLNPGLRDKLKSAVHNDHCIKAISGSVTNAASLSFPSATGCTSSFITLQDPDSTPLQGPDFIPLQGSKLTAIPRFIKAIHDSHDYCPGEIAILTEDGTEYGHHRRNSGTETPGCENKQDPLFLHFPREISKLRNAYGLPQDQPKTTDKSEAAGDTGLSLNWQDPHPYVRDDVRNYGGEQTAVSEELVLASIATVIRAQRIKALGILATDPLDTAFLIHSFRKSSPDVRLFLRDPDLLYLRTPDIGSTNGIMVIGNFPLIPQNQFWNDKNADHLILLPSASQEAEYNAFTLVLQDTLLVASAWHPPLVSPPFQLLDGEWPGGSNQGVHQWVQDKPLWLGVTGTGGYYPVAILNEKAHPAHLQAAALHALKIGRPPYVALLLLFLISLIGLIHALWATFPALVPSSFEEEFDFTEKLDTITVAKGLCHSLALLSLALGTLLVNSSFYFFRANDYALHDWHIYKISGSVVATVSVALIIAALWRVFRSVLFPWLSCKSNAEFRHNDVLGMGRLLWSTPLALVVFSAPIVYWILRAFSSTFETAFLHYRDLYLASGVAPMLPGILLVTVAYLGILAYLRRVANWPYGSVQTPPLLLDETFSGDFCSSMKSIDHWMLGMPATSRKHIALFLLFFSASILALRPWAIMDTLDPHWVYVFLCLGFLFALFVLCLNWIRFIAIWRHLRNILRGLEKLPLRLAFNRLPRENSLPIWRWSIHDQTFLPVVPGVDTLRALVREAPTILTRRSVQKLQSRVLAWVNRHQWEQINREREDSARAEQPEANYRQEREPVVSVQETPRADSRTADGTVPMPLQARATTYTGGPTLGNVTEIRRGPSDSETQTPNANFEATTTGTSSAERSSEAQKVSPCARRKQAMREARQAMTEVIQELSAVLVRDYWNRGGIALRSQETKEKKVDPGDRKYILAEDLVALRFYSYIRYVVSELRNLIFFLALSFSLLFLALHVYSFRASRGINWSLSVVFLALGAGVFWVLQQMERDPLLSRLQGTEANQLNKQFYFNLVKYGLVPFLTIVGSQVPAISNFLITKLQPTLEAFH